jgi:hypothetical protein
MVLALRAFSFTPRLHLIYTTFTPLLHLVYTPWCRHFARSEGEGAEGGQHLVYTSFTLHLRAEGGQRVLTGTCHGVCVRARWDGGWQVGAEHGVGASRSHLLYTSFTPDLHLIPDSRQVGAEHGVGASRLHLLYTSFTPPLHLIPDSRQVGAEHGVGASRVRAALRGGGGPDVPPGQGAAWLYT